MNFYLKIVVEINFNDMTTNDREKKKEIKREKIYKYNKLSHLMIYEKNK